MKNKLIIMILVCIVVATVFIPNVYSQFLNMTSQLAGRSFPAFSLENLNGNTENIKEYISGSNTIVLYWASWCPHCRNAIQLISEHKEEFDQEGIRFVLINLGEDRNTVENYIKKRNVDLDVFLDENSLTATILNIVGLPTYILVKADGIIASVRNSLPGL